MKTILILDPDSTQQKAMNSHLTQMGFAVRSIVSAEEFESLNEKFFMIILDEKMKSQSLSGMSFLKYAIRKMSGMPVVYMVTPTEKNNIESEAMKAGAYRVIERNSAAFVNLRTTLDKLSSEAPKSNWLKKLFARKQTPDLPALSM